jgi:hypothetical protein
MLQGDHAQDRLNLRAKRQGIDVYLAMHQSNVKRGLRDWWTIARSKSMKFKASDG